MLKKSPRNNKYECRWKCELKRNTIAMAQEPELDNPS
jgi:hypothetical protein